MGAFDLSRCLWPDADEGRQPQGWGACAVPGLDLVAAYSGINGFVDCTGKILTKGSAASHSITPAGRALNATALNTSVYRAIKPPASTADYVLVWHGVFVGNPTGTSAKILGIAKSTTSQSDDLISIERGSTNDTIYINARSGSSPVLREATTTATSWYGKKVTIVARYSVSKVIFDVYVCVDGVVNIYPLALSGPALPTIFGTEQFVIGADVIEDPSRFANVKTALGYVGVGNVDQSQLISLARNPWQIFTPDLGIYQIFSAGSTSAVSSDSTANYNVLGSVQSTAAASYSIRSAVQSSPSADYSVLGVAQQDGAATYAVRGAAIGDAVAAYNIIGNLAKDGLASYAILGAVLKDSTAAYSIRDAVTQDAAASYSILSSGAVTASVTAGYAIKGTTQSSIVAGYAIAAAVQAEIASSYFIHQAVAKDALPAYLICGAVSKAITAAYAVDGATGVAYARAPSGAGPQLIQPAAQRPAQTASARPSNTGGTRY